MEIKWLEDFLSLYGTGNFSRASRERHVSQPAFSRRIRALEDWLGAELIDRTTYPARPTEAGEMFLPVARDVVQRIHQAREDIARQRVDDDTLCFAMLHTLSLGFFPRWLKGLEDRTGPVGSRIWSDVRSVDGYIETLEQGLSDLLVTYQDPASSVLVDLEQFPSLPLGVETVVPAAAPGLFSADFPGTARQPLPYLRYSPYSHLGKIVAHRIRHAFDPPVHLEDRHESSLAEALKAMAVEGYGVAWLPRSSIEDALRQGTLEPLGGGAFDIQVEIRIFRHAAFRKCRVERFWSVLEQVYSARNRGAAEGLQKRADTRSHSRSARRSA